MRDRLVASGSKVGRNVRHRCGQRRREHAGFTLIEVMITVAVIAILVAVAAPSYQEFIRRARRSDAQSFLTEVAARQQHFLVDRRAYAGNGTCSTPDLWPIKNKPADSPAGLGMTVPASVEPHYDFKVAACNEARPPTFVVTATPKGPQAYDKCGTMTINQLGVKTAVKDGVEVPGCW